MVGLNACRAYAVKKGFQALVPEWLNYESPVSATNAVASSPLMLAACIIKTSLWAAPVRWPAFDLPETAV